MIEFCVDTVSGDPRLGFFQILHKLDPQKPATRRSLLFTRQYSDLARRIVAAQSAQSGIRQELPHGLNSVVLQAFHASGGDGFSNRFSEFIGEGNDSSTNWLGLLGNWLAAGYDPSDPVAQSYQVWIGRPGTAQVQLFGQPREMDVPEPLSLVQEPPIIGWLGGQLQRPAAVIAHYDVHGISMLALTRRCLASCGVRQVDSALSFEWTGDISKLWKRAVPKTLLHENDYSTVVMVDCPVHSRQPEYTLSVVGKLAEIPNTRLLIVDHHEDTFQLAPQLVELGAQIVLTDVFTCGLYDRRDEQNNELMLLGAMGDKVPEAFINTAWPGFERLRNAAVEFHRRTIQFSPTPKAMKDEGIFPLRPLWEALAEGRQVSMELAGEILGPLPEEPEPELPPYLRCGSALVVTKKPELVGRMWYGLLEKLMQDEAMPYAVALRILNGHRANFLLLNRWSEIHVPPIRMFIPNEYLPRCLGHPAAVWADLEASRALPFLLAVLDRINAFNGLDYDRELLARDLSKNILQPDAGLI